MRNQKGATAVQGTNMETGDMNEADGIHETDGQPAPA
jgi:hypothetical protein